MTNFKKYEKKETLFTQKKKKKFLGGNMKKIVAAQFQIWEKTEGKRPQ